MDASTLQGIVSEWHARLSAISESDAGKVVGTKWTRKQVLGHMIDSAVNNHHRFVRLQQGNLSGFPGYEQEPWVEAGNYNARAWSDLLELWFQYNRQLVHVIEHIDPACARNVWEDKSLPLGEIIDSYVSHVVHHLEQINK